MCVCVSAVKKLMFRDRSDKAFAKIRALYQISTLGINLEYSNDTTDMSI